MSLPIQTRRHADVRSRQLVVVAVLAAMAWCSQAWGQLGCPQPPKKPQNWVQCGECRGDLNADGLLNELDLMVFEIYENQVPQNPCADFNDIDGVTEADRQILTCIIGNSNGACDTRCGAPTNRDCDVAAIPGDLVPGGCNNPTCCQAVCDVDPLCCSIIWDAGCVNIADNICVADAPDNRPDVGDCLCRHTWVPTRLDCRVPHPWPGCSDVRCRDLVCAVDPACCNAQWDNDCVTLAKVHCQEPCTNLVLREQVCQLLPECCETVFDPLDPTAEIGAWDTSCVTVARNVLLSQPGLNLEAFPSNALLCDPEPLAIPGDQDPLGTQLSLMQFTLCLLDPAYCPPAGDTLFATEVEECLATISLNYPGCRDLFEQGQWDEACIQIADQLCRWPDPLERGIGGCLTPQTSGGCSDGYCSQLVCNLDPTCCSIAWDALCVDLAGIQCVLVPSPISGLSEVEIVGSTQIATPDGLFGCGADTAGKCCYQNFTPYCEDAACCQLVCGYDDYCCDVRWDEYCANLATAGCTQLNAECTCGPKLITNGGPTNRSCFSDRRDYTGKIPPQYLTGCEDSECCNAVCYLDPHCCDVTWDQLCADTALQVCSPFEDLFPDCGDINSGSCFIPSKTPYCDDIACCQNVCLIDISCCQIAWDQDCVDLAETECTQCGDILAGSCLSGNATPACADEECCDAVCEIDTFCCQERWDSACASFALGLPVECKRTKSCGAPTARSCFIQSPQPGCEDGRCCNYICENLDPFCCEVRWDAVCAVQALYAPPDEDGPQCLAPPAGGIRDSCLTPHPTPGCNDPICSAQVCGTEGFEYCCENRWDAACVAVAESTCVGLYLCPGPGDCFTPHPNPMCDDASCCNVVCTYDPRCCDTEWDTTCATIALNACSTTFNWQDEWKCPCEGSCFEARDPESPQPGCDDASCCAAICRIDPACCETNWDENCATDARFFCGSPLECGASVTGSCTESHDTPFCEDAACCEAVCSIDPICCSTAWDSFCVSFAEDRCRQGCGIESAGPCFFPHPSPGCNDAECCSTVCEIDPICCTFAWDATCAGLALDNCDLPECGDFPAGSCCEVTFSPSCRDRRCCESVCEKDPVCCDTTWDLVCVQLARQDDRCPCGADWDCGDPCAGDCCVPNFTPKCNDQDCCDAVCAIDSFCCDNEWDLTCASMALSNEECTGPEDACPTPECGDPDAGDCCFANGTPSCSDQECCDDVCQEDPLCCDSSWDAICAEQARTICDTLCNQDLACGDPETGPCDVVHTGPYCNNLATCECVCAFEPFCCIGDWDETCVFLATEICP